MVGVAKRDKQVVGGLRLREKVRAGLSKLLPKRHRVREEQAVVEQVVVEQASADEPQAPRTPEPPEDVLVEQVFVPRDDGTELRLLVLRVKDGTDDVVRKAMGVLWLHAGDYTTGSPEDAYPGMVPLLLRERPCVVVCPDYRLASEGLLPGTLDDCHRALVWLRDNAEALGIASGRLIVGGEGAGGGLTIALCLYERDLIRAGDNGVTIAYQMPLYPMLDDQLARTTSHSDLPPAIAYVGTHDPVLNETVDYIRNLQQDGVHTDLRVHTSCSANDDTREGDPQVAQAQAFVVRHFARAYDEWRRHPKHLRHSPSSDAVVDE